MDPRRTTTWAALSKTLALSILLTVLAGAAEARIVTIRWSSPEPSAATGFRVYARAASQSFGAPGYDGMPVAAAGVYSIQLAVSDVAATYVAATAYNGAGESARSNELLFALPICGDAVLDPGEQCDDGNAMNGDGCNTDCTISGTPAASTIWRPTDAPTSFDTLPGTPQEVGFKFKSDVDGNVIGIRFYKQGGATPNDGEHIGSLWSAAGTLLGRATFTSETDSGWQQVDFASPVAITAGVTYVASYHYMRARAGYTTNLFASAVDNAPLHALSAASSGGNGVYINSAVPAFPTATYQQQSWWVDVVFQAGTGACADGLDNDGDGLTDYPADPGCSALSDSSERGTIACDNGLDDDADTFIDYPTDSGCTSPADALESVCGNGITETGEQCDDGNGIASDGCNATCKIEVAVCGNGILQSGEACDDGNTTAGDGCGASCQIEVAVCGNGMLQSGEACDDGNTTAGDGCNANCRIEACGNAVLDAGESCDDGNKTAGDGCSATCQIEVAVCGNGMLQSGEACDDGNTTAGDGCNATCKIEACGNAVIDVGEQCDDGNAVGGDGCDAQCAIEVAGGVPYYLEVGGSSWVDPSSGQQWSSDQPYATGGVITSTPGVSISKTSLDPLYWTRRVGDGSGDIHFRLPVAGLGPYHVRLHFAELGGEVNASGARVFDVVLEGGVVGLTDFDVFRAAGGDRSAVVRDLYVLVDDGVLDIDLVPVAGLPPMIAAIEVIEGGAPPASPKIRRR